MCLACGTAWWVDPRLARGQVHLPAGAAFKLKAPWLAIGQSVAPWIIRKVRAAARGESRMLIACGTAWRVAPRLTHGWCRPKSTQQEAL